MASKGNQELMLTPHAIRIMLRVSDSQRQPSGCCVWMIIRLGPGVAEAVTRFIIRICGFLTQIVSFASFSKSSLNGQPFLHICITHYLEPMTTNLTPCVLSAPFVCLVHPSPIQIRTQSNRTPVRLLFTLIWLSRVCRVRRPDDTVATATPTSHAYRLTN